MNSIGRFLRPHVSHGCGRQLTAAGAAPDWLAGLLPAWLAASGWLAGWLAGCSGWLAGGAEGGLLAAES